MLTKHWELVDRSIGDDEGVFIIDCSGFPKQGDQSVGVKRQWCGEAGKVANCQVGVFVGHATEQGRTLLNRRLYMPKEAAEMVAEIVESQQLCLGALTTCQEEYYNKKGGCEK